MSGMPLPAFSRVDSRSIGGVVWGSFRYSGQKEKIMSTARFDGAYLAPAARLRPHGALRCALARTASTREETAQRFASGYLRARDDAAIAAFGVDRTERERVGQSFYPF
jgi:hypothetical protein